MLAVVYSSLNAGNGTRRILSLSDEITELKLQGLQDRRQIMILREEKRRLDATIASHEAVLSMADRARVEAEARSLLSPPEVVNNSRPASIETYPCTILPVSFDTRYPSVFRLMLLVKYYYYYSFRSACLLF